MLLIDAANVVGSRPIGWWRDRAGATRTFVEEVRAAVASARLVQPVVVVLEGKARDGVEPGHVDGVTVEHAGGSGDDLLVEIAGRASDQKVTLITADRELRRRVEALGADVVGPNGSSSASHRDRIARETVTGIAQPALVLPGH